MNKKMMLLLAALCGTLMPLAARQKADFRVVPLPRQVTVDTGKPSLKLRNLTVICAENADDQLTHTARLLASSIEQAHGLKLAVRQGKVQKRESAVVLRLNPQLAGTETYRIVTTSKLIQIEGQTAEAVFRGTQTLRKALPAAVADSIEVPATTVADAPRFAYRGMHLDVARHFFGPDVVKEYIDMLALHGINRLHWHITDDQGWRIQINAYPDLTAKGAWRNRTVVGRNAGVFDYQRYGGYFTQREARDIVEYARQRFITVIPEIDMPGHMLAALAACPQLGCTGGPYEVEPTWGVFDDILCAGNDDTYAFVRQVLAEIIDIFPSEYIHIGGDEVPKTRWEKCPRCQRLIARLGLKADGAPTAAGSRSATPEDLLQGYFMRQVEQFLNEHGRKAIGWDEILDYGVTPSTTIMSWRGIEGGLRAASQGHQVIMVPTSPMYFDYYQQPETTWNKPFLIGGFEPLPKVYAFEPSPDSLSAEARARIIGVQANLWTEYVTCRELLHYQALPRMGALAEVQWTRPEDKDYADFFARLTRLTAHYERLGWAYCKYEWQNQP